MAPVALEDLVLGQATVFRPTRHGGRWPPPCHGKHAGKTPMGSGPSMGSRLTKAQKPGASLTVMASLGDRHARARWIVRLCAILWVPGLVHPHAKTRSERRDVDRAVKDLWTLGPSCLLRHDHTPGHHARCLPHAELPRGPTRGQPAARSCHVEIDGLRGASERVGRASSLALYSQSSVTTGHYNLDFCRGNSDLASCRTGDESA